MDNRERFRTAMKFQPTDQPCHLEHGFFQDTYDCWRKEGLPVEIIYDPDIFHHTNGPDLFDYFDITKFAYMTLEQYYVPPFKRQILEENPDYKLLRNERGVLLKEKLGNVSMPQFLEYPIKTRQDYHALKDRLLGSPKQRFPAYWDEQVQFVRNQRDRIVGVHLDGFFGYPRELMGVVQLLTTYYDDPELIQEIINDRVEADIQLYEQAIEEIRPDFAFIWEDMCYKNGPLLSPAMFRKFMLPAYQKLTGFIKKMGVETIIVDSDGDISQLIPLWIEGGVTCLLPFEVKAGMDVTKFREQYPKLQIIGGIDKHALEHNQNNIDRELERVLPIMLPQGGYCVALDHWVHSEIPLEKFAYYVERIRKYPCENTYL
jgi:uroporphyrinogen decarboxylase